jgi:hypothetical protein
VCVLPVYKLVTTQSRTHAHVYTLHNTTLKVTGEGVVFKSVTAVIPVYLQIYSLELCSEIPIIIFAFRFHTQ